MGLKQNIAKAFERLTTKLPAKISASPRLIALRDKALALRGGKNANKGEYRSNLATKSLMAFVFAPTFIYFLYVAFWQTPGYVAEARATVRTAQDIRAAGGGDIASSIMGKLSSGGGRSSLQDSYIVQAYFKSAAVVNDLGGQAYMEKYFSQPGIDYFSRLKKGAKTEDLLKYWLSHTSVSVDTLSGIVTMQIVSFRPEDSVAIAKDVVRLSEELINKITLRNRGDALARSEQEIVNAAEKLADARSKLTQFRNANALIEPSSNAQNIAEVIGKLMLEKINIESSLTTLEGTINNTSPVRRVQLGKLATIEQQIADLKSKLTNQKDPSQALSSQIAAYEGLKLNEQFAQRLYAIAQASYERARQELETKQLYLAVIVPPLAPQEAAYPKIFASTLLLLVTLFVIWAIVALLVASVEDQTV